MSELPVRDSARDAGEAPRSAGALLREARQAQGLHIAALAAAIKVSQKKLELLEADRVSELPDATFTRALAQTVCRALKIDPAPVLALLPAPAGHRLEHVGEGINAPFRDRPGRREPSDWGMLASPAVWGPLLIVLGAAALYFLPSGWLPNVQLPSSAPAASAPAAAASVVSSTVTLAAPAAPETNVMPSAAATDAVAPAARDETARIAAPQASPSASTAVVATAPPAATPAARPATTAASVPAVPAAGLGVLQLHTHGDSWIEVQDARSKVLISRLVQRGEIVALDGATPLRVKIGNAGATEVLFRGQALDLAPSTRDNVARLELK